MGSQAFHSRVCFSIHTFLSLHSSCRELAGWLGLSGLELLSVWARWYFSPERFCWLVSPVFSRWPFLLIYCWVKSFIIIFYDMAHAFSLPVESCVSFPSSACFSILPVLPYLTLSDVLPFLLVNRCQWLLLTEWGSLGCAWLFGAFLFLDCSLMISKLTLRGNKIPPPP